VYVDERPAHIVVASPPLWLDRDLLIHMRLDPPAFKPSDLVESRPQFRRLVDIDLAGLLRVRFPELLAKLCPPHLLDKDPALGAEVDGRGEPQGRCQLCLSWVQLVEVWLVLNRQRVASPVRLKYPVVVAGQALQWRCQVWQCLEITVFSGGRSKSLTSWSRGAVSRGTWRCEQLAVEVIPGQKLGGSSWRAAMMHLSHWSAGLLYSRSCHCCSLDGGDRLERR
jgi:hypothetical protein